MEFRNFSLTIKDRTLGGLRATVGAAVVLALSSVPAYGDMASLRPYFQCGGTPGLEFANPNEVFLVEEIKDSKGNTIHSTYPLGYLAGSCGNPQETYEYTNTATLSRAAAGSDGSVRGISDVLISCPSWAAGFILGSGVQGEGFTVGSGGLSPQKPGETQLFIDASKPLGIHSGTEVLSCITPNGSSVATKKLGYSIVLTP